MVLRQRRHQWHAHANAFGLLAFSDGQALSGLDPIHALVVDVGVLRAQNVVDHAIAPTSAGMGGLDDLLAQFHIERTGVLNDKQKSPLIKQWAFFRLYDAQSLKITFHSNPLTDQIKIRRKRRISTAYFYNFRKRR